MFFYFIRFIYRILQSVYDLLLIVDHNTDYYFDWIIVKQKLESNFLY